MSDQRSGCLLPLLFIVVSTVVALGAAEWTLRTFAPIRLTGIQGAYRYDEEVGFLLRPGIHLLESTDHQQEIHTNTLGTVNFQEDFSGYASRVFALGDSFTQGTGLPADASFPFQLDMLLNRDSQGLYRKRAAIVNLGLAAFGAEQSLRVLQRFSERLGPPDAVLYLGYENDHRDDIAFRSGYSHRHIVHGSPTWGPFVGPLLWANRLELFKRTKYALASIRRGRLDREARADGSEAQSVAERQWPVIESIAERCERVGAFVVLSWAEGDSPSYAWLQERARERGIAFADWYPAVLSVREAMPRLGMKNPHSGGHWRSWVNGRIAEAFARQLGPRIP